MKAAAILTVAGLVPAAFAFAIPTNMHKNIREPRNRFGVPVVETVVTVYYETVIWVDTKGNTVSTEINTPPPGIATTTIEPISSMRKPAPSSNGAAEFGDRKRPQNTPTSSSSTPSSAASSTLPVSNVFSPAETDSNIISFSTISNMDGTPIAADEAIMAAQTAPGGMGICYDMIDSQTRCKGFATINSEFLFLRSQGFGIVRIYDIGCPVGDFVNAAAQQGLRIMVGINSISNYNSDLGKLIGMVNGNWGAVDSVYICNECVNNGQASASDVAGKVSAAKSTLRSSGFNGHVVTVDTMNQMINDPTICSTSDYCATNIHAFFDPNTSASEAGTFVHNMYQQVANTNSGKRIVVTESGWPYQGQCNGQACPSVENQKTAINSIMSSFAGSPSNLFLFQAYNAGYKAGGQFGIEPYFGIFDGDHYSGGIGA